MPSAAWSEAGLGVFVRYTIMLMDCSVWPLRPSDVSRFD